MWTAVLFLGLGLAMDPLRLGLVIIVLSRQRPLPNLVAFWLGGMVAGVGVGLAALVFFRGVALAAIETLVAVTDSVRTSVVILAGGGLEITLGVLALTLLSGLMIRQRVRVSVGDGDSALDAVEPRTPGFFAILAAFSQNMLKRGVWPAFLIGLGSATPPVEFVVLLTIVSASHAEPAAQVSAVVVFTVLVLLLVELPLVTYLAMPQRTKAAMLRLDGWLSNYRRQIFQVMLAITGVVLLVRGVIAL
jgi:hypothetical protein